MISEEVYTSKLGAGLGLIEETLALLEIWSPELDANQHYLRALESGRFPGISARRLKNIMKECFAPRYLCNNAIPATIIKSLMGRVPNRNLQQLMFLFTARVNPILYDFILEVYWPAYVSGKDKISNEYAREFVHKAVSEGRTGIAWSDKVTQNVAGYLTGCCADYGLLESGRRRQRAILPFQLCAEVSIILAYDLHFEGLGDNAILGHNDWNLFGLQREDVLDELKRMSLKGFFILQAAGDITRISWNHKSWEDLLDAIIER